MLFNSYIFIFVFLPLTLGSYYGLHKLGKPVFAKVALILMSFWFYGYFNPSYLWIMCSSIVVNYLLSQLLQRRWGGHNIERTACTSEKGTAWYWSDIQSWSDILFQIL